MRNSLLLLLAIFFSLTGGSGQGTQVEFGKNRVQYHNDFEEWSQYESDNFYVYWYGQSRNIAQAAVQLAELDFSEIQSLLEHRINEKVQIIVYTDITDFKQSNIGSEEAFSSVAGQTKIVGSTIFVYFDGDHSKLRKQIREGIASVYLNTMLFGANIQEVVQNAVMLNLPMWFKDGLVAYAAEPWSTENDNALCDAMASKKYKGFVRLAEDNPRLAGHALWYYIAENFGRTAVSNLLYLTRINRSVESGFLYVMGTSYPAVVAGWETYFSKRYQEDQKGREAPAGAPLAIRNRKNYPLSQLKLSPDGNTLAYALNRAGRFKVYLYDLQKNTSTVIFKGGQRNLLQATDYNYPLLAWNPNNTQLSVVFEYRDDLRFATYDLKTRKTTTELLEETYQRVFDMDYVDPFSLVFSAAVSSQSDLFLYLPRTRSSRRLTNDFYDEQDLAFVNLRNRKGVIFASNRPDTLLPLAPVRRDTVLPRRTFDLFYLDLEGEARELVRITRTPLSDERFPAAVDTAYFTYLSDRSGIYNQESGFLEDFVHHRNQHIFLADGTEVVIHEDSTLESLDTTLIDSIQIRPVIRQRAVTFACSNLDRNLEALHTSPRGRKQVELIPRLSKSLVLVQALQIEPKDRPADTYYQQVRKRFIRAGEDTLHGQFSHEMPPSSAILVREPSHANPDTLRIPEGFLFQSRFGYPVSSQPLQEEGRDSLSFSVEPRPAPPVVLPLPVAAFDAGMADESQKPLHRINTARITPYRLQFRTDEVTTQMDNTLLFEGLDNLAGNPEPGFSPPPAGILMKATVKDLLEDYQMEGGMRFPTSFNGAEYFFVFDNKKKRLDQRFAFYTKNLRYNDPPAFNVPRRRETNILLGQYGLRYPLDVFQSLRATATVRRDRVLQMATDQTTLNIPVASQQRIGLRLEYVFDNTVETALNMRNGARMRVMGEVMKKFSFKEEGQKGFSFQDGYMGILGLDARYYQPVLKHSILAARLAGMTSFGSEKILYYLGGVDNWLFPENNETIDAPQGNFAFQTLAANLRGFPINVRNGNSYLLLNAEMRVPVFRYLSKRLNSGFLRNFQVVGFFDVGTAWAGSDPFREDNPLNTTVFKEGEEGKEFIFITLNYFRDPIVAGYGLGARALLFGYFVRVDYAWGLETRQIQDPKLYISLGFDF
ncbi:MAG: hypothetical protein KIPDCIKN_02338 [Haliscomenobacter sp.]|nr:hypothetical protein [Haliscomenobacter sp.]